MRPFALVGLVGLVVLPILFVRGLLDDLDHPERWNASPMHEHDPRVYVPVGGSVLLVAATLLVRELLRPRLAVRLQRLLDEARRLRHAGRYDEAGRVLDQFERLWRWHRLDKRRPLRE